MYQETRNLK